MYVHVYSPEGEFFEVPRSIADRLILEEGWTQSPITVEPVETVADGDSDEQEG
jgi:hypothetical protein